MFDRENFRPTYSSDDSSLLDDFYIPALKECKFYDRAVGFFSAAMLTHASQGLGELVKRNGRMRLVIGEELKDDEYNAVKEGNELRKIYEKLELDFEKIAKDVTNHIFVHRLKIISWLVAKEQLEIRLAITKKGMYHEKIGIMTFRRTRISRMILLYILKLYLETH